jgi:thiamine transport system ATP-binding protein
MIRLEGVRFRYEAAMMEFDLAVADGELLGIIGPSGAGKSTLLALIAGFETPEAGRVAIGDVDAATLPPQARPVSMIFQDHNSFAHLDAWTNVALGVSPALRLSAAEKSIVDQALDRVGLAGLAKRLPGDLSGGERQRIAIARALVRKKPVLLLDEPFTALGPRLRREMLDLILALKAEHGLTILLVTHEPADAHYAASHIAFVDEGRIVAKRPAQEFFSARGIAGLDGYLGERHG